MDAATLPEDFKKFCESAGVDMGEFAMLGKLPRYVRFTPAALPAAGSGALAEQRRRVMAARQPRAEEVEFFGEAAVWRLPHDAKIHGCELYRAGVLAGIDLGSIVAVAVLGVGLDDSVLELCCAPGAKLLLASESTTGYITGVDVSLPRLSTARSLITKYKSAARAPNNVRLVLADGTTYTPAATASPWWVDGRPLASVNPSRHRKKLAGVYPKSPADAPGAGVVLLDFAPAVGAQPPATQADVVEPEGPSEARPGQKRTASDMQLAAAGAKKRKQMLAALARDAVSIEEYDRVLVDAECTTDGSLRHVEKLLAEGVKDWREVSGWGTKGREDLFALQTALLRKGVALCRPGGTVVYCTCSLSRHQNEAVVEAVLADGVVEPLPLLAAPAPHAWLHLAGLPSHRPAAPPLAASAATFTPLTSACGALFVAKFRKRTAA